MPLLKTCCNPTLNDILLRTITDPKQTLLT